jgi:hypothetical protein
MAFLVRPTAKGFRVLEESWNPHKVKTVPATAYAALGFNPDMTVDQAKARAKQLNGQSGSESKRISNTARRVELMNTEARLYLSADDVSRFEAEIHDMYADNPYRLEITLRYWKAAQLAILELAVDVKDFRAANRRFLNYFKKKSWSHDYIKRITRVLNLWGDCVSRYRGSRFDPIPKLNSVQVQKINDLHFEADGVRLPAEPLPWIELRNAKDKFESEGLGEHWNWMFIATWFGLRPLEVDNLKNPKFTEVRFDDHLKLDVLWVYQSKLVAIEREKRWKPIPVYTKEQREALIVIRSGHYKRPLNKTLQRLLGDGIQLSSPRKSFVDLFLDLNFDLVDISVFMGHQTLKMTRNRYKDRQKFRLPKSG